jgi:dihydroorotate dehydrogenase (NAD+) catalytic subunit
MSVFIGDVEIALPLINGSGAFDISSAEPNWAADVHLARQLGAYVTKTVTVQPRFGNPQPRIAEWPGGLINAVGIANPGIVDALHNWREQLAVLGIPVFLSVYGTPESLQEMVEIAERSDTPISGYELNLSCPNVDGRIDVEASVGRVRGVTSKALIAKLAPDTSNIVEWSRTAENCGADGITAVNTLRTRAIHDGVSVLGSEFGGVSGAQLHELALECVARVREAVSIPIIGIGGVDSVECAEAMLAAGADIVGVGTWAKLESGLIPTLRAWSTSGSPSTRSLAHAGKSH